MLTVCNYHYIRNNFDSPYSSIFGVTQEQFEHQITQLLKTYKYVTIDALQNDINSILATDENFMLITFDDGLKEQYELALPILKSSNIPAYFFINTINHIEKKVSSVHKIHLLRSILSPKEIIQLLESTFNRKTTAIENNKAQKFYRYDKPENAIVKYLFKYYS
jgi:hypothetical protein